MADCSSIEQRLNRARATLDDWLNGEHVSRFQDQNGESVTYSTTGAVDRLEKHIAKLENELAVCKGSASAYRGPLRFTYGVRRF